MNTRELYLRIIGSSQHIYVKNFIFYSTFTNGFFFIFPQQNAMFFSYFLNVITSVKQTQIIDNDIYLDFLAVLVPRDIGSRV